MRAETEKAEYKPLVDKAEISQLQYDAYAATARVVRDGNLITGGGVTAGIDIALTIAAEIADEETAKTIQLMIEYAPAPPYACGRPETADPEIIAAVNNGLNNCPT